MTTPTPTPIQGYSTPTGGGFTLPTVPAVTVTSNPVVTPTIPTPIPIVTNDKQTGSVVATSGPSSLLDSNGMADVSKANVDNTALTESHNNYLSLLDTQNSALETRRQNEISSINSSFDAAGSRLKTSQAGETGTYTSTLARIGGYLGNSASGTGAMINLNNTHVQQVSDLEGKRQAALQEANNAISDKQFEIARAKMSEVKDYTKAIQDSKQKFFENNQKIIQDQQQGQKDAAIAKIYSEGTTDIPTILKSLSGSGLNITANDIQSTIKNIVPPAIDDLIKTLNQYGAPTDVKMKVMGSTNMNDAYKNAGAWASLGGTGIIGEYNFYKADAISKGLTPVDFNTYQTTDANRKATQGTTQYVGGSAYTTPGASGEYGAYQFTPPTWKDYAGQVLNDPNAPMTPANQDAVAVGMVSKWLADGKTLEQIATKWNHGDFSYQGSGKGVNSLGVAYDIPGYVAKFKDNLANLGGGKDPSTVAKAIKLTETGGGPGDVAVERAVNIINGSNKFTKDQKNNFTVSMNNAANISDAFAVIKNQAKENLSGTTKTTVENTAAAQAAFEDMANGLKDFYTAGGDTNIVKGNFESLAGSLGTVSDPKQREIATRIEASLQAYRKAISGTAFSNQEAKSIASIFPGIDKTESLNNSIISARTDIFQKQLDAAYETVLPKDVYQSLKEAANTSNQTTGDVLAQKMDQQLNKLTQNYSDPVKKADIDSKISTIETSLGRKISKEEFLQAYPSYGN